MDGFELNRIPDYVPTRLAPPFREPTTANLATLRKGGSGGAGAMKTPFPDYMPARQAKKSNPPPSYLENEHASRTDGLLRCQRCGAVLQRPFHFNEEEGWFCESPCWPIVEQAVRGLYDRGWYRR